MWSKLKNLYHRTAFKLYSKLDNSNHEIKQVAIIESLNPNEYKRYNVNKASSFILPLIFRDIKIYVNKIDYLIYHIKEHNGISNTWCNYEYYEGPLSSFILDNGYIVNPEIEVALFKSKVLEISILIDELKKSEDLTDQHNLRMVNRFHSHLVDLILKLTLFVKKVK